MSKYPVQVSSVCYSNVVPGTVTVFETEPFVTLYMFIMAGINGTPNDAKQKSVVYKSVIYLKG